MPLYVQTVPPSRLRRDVDAFSSTYTSATGIDLKGEREGREGGEGERGGMKGRENGEWGRGKWEEGGIEGGERERGK